MEAPSSEPTAHLELSDAQAQAILDGLKRESALKEATNQQLADMLTNHVWGDIPINTAKSDLVSEAIDRIERLDKAEAENERMREVERQIIDLQQLLAQHRICQTCGNQLSEVEWQSVHTCYDRQALKETV